MVNNNIILKKKIELFRNQILRKETPFKFQPTFFDILLGNIFNLIYLNLFKLIRKIIINFVDMIKNIKNYSELFFQSLKNLEKKIDSQEKIIEQSLKLNSSLYKQIDELKIKLNSIIENNKVEYNERSHKSIPKNPKSKEEFYQGENLRLSTQLHQMNKKYEILKEEINKFENQRSNLISKINSVNEVIKDTNVLTNVFENNVDSKIKIIDPIKQANKNIKRDLDEEISKIFSK
ncbi:MAG: hypothetical protein CMC10_08320 [Flavobacteriaceae bacterium]|nr:hypothetical protein [Flavobacteriaceae bacterium]|tara:strand:+ start:4932 stop:5633 length:702 start_codon:yes stop_codon:yes gene_type:complete